MLHQDFRAETPIEYYEDPLHMTGPRPEYDIRDATVRARLLEKARAPPDADVGMGHALHAATGKDWGQDCSNAVCMVPPAPHVSATPVLLRWLVSAELFPWVHLFLARRCPGVTAHHTHVPLGGPIVSRPLVLPSNTQSRCARHGAWRSTPHSSSGTGGSSTVALSVRSKCIHRGFWHYKPCPPQTVRLPTHPPRGEKAGGDREPSPSVHTDEGEERNRSRQTRSAAVLHAVARNRSRQIRTLAALDAVARSPGPLKPGTSAFGAVPSTRHWAGEELYTKEALEAREPHPLAKLAGGVWPQSSRPSDMPPLTTQLEERIRIHHCATCDMVLNDPQPTMLQAAT